MAVFSRHITVLIASMALLVTSAGAVPIAFGEPSPTDTDIVYLDELHHAATDQFRPPALPSFLPLEGDIVGRPSPHYPPGHATTIEGQEFIDTQGRSAARHREEILSTSSTHSPSTVVVGPNIVNESVTHGNPQKTILADLDYDITGIFGDIGDFESSPVVFPTLLRPSSVKVESTKARDSAVSNSLPIVFPSDKTTNGFATVEAIEQLAQQPISAPQKPETLFRVQNVTDNQPFNISQTLPQDSHSEVHITESEPQAVESLPQLLEPGSSIPKIINKPGNPVNESYPKPQEEVQPTPQFPLGNGTSSYLEYIPVAPITKAILNLIDDAPAEYVASLNGTYDDHPRGAYDNKPGAIFFPQNPQLTYSSYSKVPATSFVVLEPSAVPEGAQGAAPYNGFLATLWNTGSPGQTATGLATNVWKGITDGVTKKVAKKWEGFNKIVGKKVGTKGKKLLIKTAPIVKKLVGLKAAANLFQGAGITAAEIGGEGDLVAPVVIEYQAPSASHGAPLAETKQVEPEAPKLINGAPTQVSQPIYGAPPQISQPILIPAVPKQSYGAPSVSSLLHSYESQPSLSHYQPATPVVAFPTAPIKPEFKTVTEVAAPEHHEVAVPEPAIVTVTETKHTYPAVPKPEYDPTLQYRPLPSQQQTIPVPAPVVYMPAPQAQQVGYFSYILPQASHLIRNQGTNEEQSNNHGITRTRKGIFGIVNKVEEGYNNAYNVFQYGRNLTNQASESLSSLWPGNWFRSTGEVAQASSAPFESQYGAPQPTYGAPPQALQPTYGAPLQASQHTYGAPRQAPQPIYDAPPQAPQPASGAQLQAPQSTYDAPPQVPQHTYGTPPQAPLPPYGSSPHAPQPTYGAPVSSILAPFLVPVVANPQVSADGTHVYQYPVKSDVPASSGYVAHYEHETAHAPYAPSYVAPFSGPVVQGKEEGSSAAGLSFGSILGQTKIGRLVNFFSSK